MKNNKIFILFISLLSTIIFGFIESLSFLFAEDYFQNIFSKIGFDIKSSEILTSSLSTSISIFAAVWIEAEIVKRYNIINSPLISSIGILLGSLFFVIIYNVIIKILENNKKNE